MADHLEASVWDDTPAILALPPREEPLPWAEPSDTWHLQTDALEDNPFADRPVTPPVPVSAPEVTLPALMAELVGSPHQTPLELYNPNLALFADEPAVEAPVEESAEEPVAAPTRKLARLYKGKRLYRQGTPQGSGLDPLGGPLAAEQQALPDVISAAELLARAADAPLFQIESAKAERVPAAEPATETAAADAPAAAVPARAAFKPTFVVSVGDPVKVGELTNAHIVYTITTTKDLNGLLVQRRYRDFRWLYHQLQLNHPGYIIPPPPVKQAVGRFNEGFVEHRRHALETMLTRCSMSEVLHNDPDLEMFLTLDDFSRDTKNKDKSSGGPEDADWEPVAEESGFFSKVVGLSTARGYVEEDVWFIARRQQLTQLEAQLLAFTKALDTVVQHRSELAATVQELGAAAQEWADLDAAAGDMADEATVELLGLFAQVQTRLHELTLRLLTQDVLTVGAVCDEYVRTIGLIKAVFQQRVSALVAVGTADSELQRAMKQAAKAEAAGEPKAAGLAQLADKQKQKVAAAKERAEQIDKTIRDQMAVFEQERIEAFRNAAETYLESNVELLKEQIEIWETFWEQNQLGNA